MVSLRARALRTTLTDAERRLWSILRGRQLRGFKFRRQRPFGPYILDFVCLEHRLVIETDGGQHADNAQDAIRTAWLEKRGWRVMRFWNNEILQNADGIADTILGALTTMKRRDLRYPHPPSAPRWAPPSPASGRGA
jgi:very-short-patch-repair endonuclease